MQIGWWNVFLRKFHEYIISIFFCLLLIFGKLAFDWVFIECTIKQIVSYLKACDVMTSSVFFFNLKTDSQLTKLLDIYLVCFFNKSSLMTDK